MNNHIFRRDLDSFLLNKLPRRENVHETDSAQQFRTYAVAELGCVLPGPDFNRLVLRIAMEPDGAEIAIEILVMRLSFEGRRNSTDSELIDIGCDLMRRVSFVRRSNADSYRLGIVARYCLIGEQGVAAVRDVCRNLKEAISKSETHAYYHTDLLQILSSTQPLALLDGLCGGNEAELRAGVAILAEASQLRRNPFDAIPEADLLSWCEQQPQIRYPWSH
jgi:hypothetical protein